MDFAVSRAQADILLINSFVMASLLNARQGLQHMFLQRISHALQDLM
jgi:hypothetical protein